MKAMGSFELLAQYAMEIDKSLRVNTINKEIESASDVRIKFIPIGYDWHDYEKVIALSYNCFFEDEIILKKERMLSRLIHLLGKAQKIYARQTLVKRISNEDARSFLNTHHIMGYTSCYYKYGLYYKDELKAVMTFSKSRVMNDKKVYYRSYELVRFCNASETIVVGGMSKLFKKFLEETGARHVMTYIDHGFGYGNSYLDLGFKISKRIPQQLYYFDKTTMKKRYVLVDSSANENKLICKDAGGLKLIYDAV
jgi:hypothetical protein